MRDESATSLFLGHLFEKPKGRVVLRFEEGTLVLQGDRIEESVGHLSFLLYDERIQAYRSEALFYRHLLGDLLRAGLEVLDKARKYSEEERPLFDSFKPFEHQSQGLKAWEDGEKRGIVVLPTGAGKSYLAALAIERARRSTLVIVPTLDLLNQWGGNLERSFRCPIGMLGGGVHELQSITVSTYDSAAIHMPRYGDRFGLLIFDEVHHLPGEMYSQAARLGIAPFRLGLTATPERADGKERDLDELVGPILYRRSIKELAGTILADYEVRTIEIAMNATDRESYEEERKIYRDFVESKRIRLGGAQGWRRFLAATSQSDEGRRAFKAHRAQKRLALVHEEKLGVLYDLLHSHKEERILIFTNDNASVYKISERLLCPSITHETGIKERRAILDHFRKGKVRILVTSKVLNEGVDIPEASIAIILAGSGSVREHVQRLGRILRKQEGKKALLYELVTSDSVEGHVSQRRREHDAYQ